MRRVGVERLAELVSEISRGAVFVWLSCGGFGDRGVVEFGELNQIFVGFAVGSVL